MRSKCAWMPRITILLLVITPLPFGALTARADPFLPPPLLSSPEIHQLSTPSPVIEDPRVLYWNMRWFPAGPGDDLTGPRAMKKIESCAQTLQATNADILFLSEVINLESLKKMDLHYPYLVCSDIERHPSSPSRLPAQNLAFFSRIRPERVWVVDFERLPDTPDRPSRGMLAVQFRIDPGTLLTCYALHLKSNLGGYRQTSLRRERAIDYLFRDLSRLDLDPLRDLILICGDMNTSVSDPQFRRERTLRRLMEKGFELPAPILPGRLPEPDPPASGSMSDFDYFFLSRALHDQLSKSGQNPQVQTRAPVPRYLSDHELIEIQLKGLVRRQSAP
jgi:endonuclease/exonuclease/phosphatase family metal-dependent hydrolase